MYIKYLLSSKKIKDNGSIIYYQSIIVQRKKHLNFYLIYLKNIFNYLRTSLIYLIYNSIFIHWINIYMNLNKKYLIEINYLLINKLKR
jgi:hypothetical protein